MGHMPLDSPFQGDQKYPWSFSFDSPPILRYNAIFGAHGIDFCHLVVRCMMPISEYFLDILYIYTSMYSIYALLFHYDGKH